MVLGESVLGGAVKLFAQWLTRPPDRLGVVAHEDVAAFPSVGGEDHHVPLKMLVTRGQIPPLTWLGEPTA